MKKILFLLYIVLFAVGCGRDNKPNTSDIEIDLQIDRFEKDIMEVDLGNIESSVDYLKSKYGDFLDLFSIEVINIGSPDKPTYPDYLQRFVTDYLINEVYQDVSVKFDDIDPLQNKLEKAFTNYKYYFPNEEIPGIVTYISGFNHSMAVTEKTLGIGLDKYLGTESDYYIQLGYEQYRKNKMHPEKIPSDALIAFAMTKYPYNDSTDNLLSQMIYHGKMMYFTQKMLPDEPEYLVFGFTPTQMKFCENNEETMWLYLVENKLLFNTDLFTIRKFVGEAPFTKDFTTDSPGRAAVWVGYRIVENFMKRNRRITLPQLMDKDNYQEILKESNYHP